MPPTWLQGGTVFAVGRVVHFREEANKRTEAASRRQGSRARCRLDFDNLLPGDTLVATQALLRHPPVEGQWLEGLAKLAGKA